MFTGGQMHEYVQGESTFYIRPMDPFSAVNLLADISKTLSPIIGKASGALLNNGKKKDSNKENTGIFDMDLNGASIEAIFTAIAENVDGQKIENLMKRILNDQYVSVQTTGSNQAVRLTKEAIAELYTGNPQNMFLLAFEVLKVNYGGFTKLFGSLSGNVQGLLRREK